MLINYNCNQVEKKAFREKNGNEYPKKGGNSYVRAPSFWVAILFFQLFKKSYDASNISVYIHIIKQNLFPCESSKTVSPNISLCIFKFKPKYTAV